MDLGILFAGVPSNEDSLTSSKTFSSKGILPEGVANTESTKTHSKHTNPNMGKAGDVEHHVQKIVSQKIAKQKFVSWKIDHVKNM